MAMRQSNLLLTTDGDPRICYNPSTKQLPLSTETRRRPKPPYRHAHPHELLHCPRGVIGTSPFFLPDTQTRFSAARRRD